VLQGPSLVLFGEADDELGRFLAAAEIETPRFAAAFWVQARAGLRPSEAMGLNLESPDLIGGKLLVERSLYQGKLGESTKTGESRRVDMSEQLAERLRGQVIKRKAENLKRGWTSDLLCIGRSGGALDLANMGRAFRTVLRRAGISTQHSPYDLRHTFATMLLRKTRDLAYVARQLGHSRPTTTLQWYVHFVPEILHGDQQALVNVLDATLPTHSSARPAHVTPADDVRGATVAAVSMRKQKWRRVDSNHGPRDYETLALAT
jgi:integrase